MRSTLILAAIGIALAAFVNVGCDQNGVAPTTNTTPTTPSTTGDTSTTDTTPAPADNTGNTTPTAPDNTAVNERDAEGNTKTPIDQDENSADVKITANIRSRITGDSSMSVNARNVKIVTSQGKVTLRGPVDSAAEKDAIEVIARDVAGEGNVDNQIEVVNR
jgi:hyperosmotically inducible periplasmic protein